MEMVEREKDNGILNRIAVFLVFTAILILSVLYVSTFVSGLYLLIVFSGMLGFSVIWVVILVNKKYALCKLQLPILSKVEKIGYFAVGLFYLSDARFMFLGLDGFKKNIVIGIALAMFSFALFSRTKKKSINDYKDPLEKPVGRKSLFFIFLFWGLFWFGCCINWCMSVK